VAKVYIRFPGTGLGNMLLVWAKGIVFAQLNNLPYTTTLWGGVHWGALLRREKKNRFYFGYFTETSLWKRLAIRIYCISADVELNPVVEVVAASDSNEKKVYLFNKALTGTDVFGSIRDHSAMVTKELFNTIPQKMKNKLSGYQNPVVGIHIRRGDFKLGNQTTPLEYFIKAINVVRAAFNQNCQVTVFTDAHEAELTELLCMPNIHIAEDKPDILDIILLSRSKIMILSKSSTFGYWAAFLSDAIVIRPVNDWQPLIKNNSMNGYRDITWNYEVEESAYELKGKLITEKRLLS